MTALSLAASEAKREPHTLFDLDERLVELMDRAEEAAEGNGISEELLQEINDYLDAFRTKVDRIAGYWRWQESIAAICREEEERFCARKRAAEGRLGRLKQMLLYFLLSRGLKKIEGEKASIGLQGDGMASLVIDDPCQIEDRFFETTLRITKSEFRGIIRPLPDGEIRRKLEFVLGRSDWAINSSAVRSALTNNVPVAGPRLVKGHHLRLR